MTVEIHCKIDESWIAKIFGKVTHLLGYNVSIGMFSRSTNFATILMNQWGRSHALKISLQSL